MLNNDLVPFMILVGLGFMPLIVIHYADRHPRFRWLAPRQRAWPAATVKTSLLLVITDWLMNITW